MDIVEILSMDVLMNSIQVKDSKLLSMKFGVYNLRIKVNGIQYIAEKMFDKFKIEQLHNRRITDIKGE